MSLFDSTVLTVLSWVIALAWVGIIIAFIAAYRRRSSLKPLTTEVTTAELPELSVILAARNESAGIETCIRSLFRQDYPRLEVVAVNDRSTDDTGTILNRLAEEFAGRLKVVHVTTLPSGWSGKPHALDLGLRSASGSMVCFTDADCEFLAPTALRTTLSEMQRQNLDFFSIAAKYTFSTLQACATVPCCSEAVLMWLRPERIGDPKWPDAFANGACIMVRRAPFESLGGWGAVRHKISEDLELARLAKRSGQRLGVAFGEGFYQTASYGTLRESWKGWSRILKGSLTPAQLMITVARMLVLFALPLGMMLVGLATTWRTGSVDWLTHGAGPGFAIAFALRGVLDLFVFRMMEIPLVTVLFAPLGRLFVMGASIRALMSHAGLVQTHWRGNTFAAGQIIMTERAQA